MHPLFVSPVLFWHERYVQNYVFAFCACGWGWVLFRNFFAGKGCFYVSRKQACGHDLKRDSNYQCPNNGAFPKLIKCKIYAYFLLNLAIRYLTLISVKLTLISFGW
jgi:hypothetical protein